MPIVEVPEDAVDELPDEAEERDDLLTQDEVDDIVQTRLNRERSNLRDDLQSDEEFLREAMQQTFGVELREDGRPKGAPTDDEVQEMRQRISELESAAEERDQLRERIDSVRETELENELLSSADGVKDDMQDVFMSYAKTRMTYDDEYGWVATNDEGEIEFEGGEPVKPSDFVERTQEQRPSMFQDASMSNGPDGDPSDEPGDPDTVTKSEFDEMPPDQQKQVALDEGTQIVPDSE
jgi:hypothetical protein